MTMRFLITGDWHFRGSNPRARLDNYQEALIAKVREVYTLAQEHDCWAIIVPGDLCDSPTLAYSTFSTLGTLLQQAPRPVLTVPGNHDLFGANPETKSRTVYGALSELRIIRDLSSFRYERGFEACFQGTGFSTETDSGPDDYLFQPLTVPFSARIKVAHGMLLDRAPGISGLRHTLIDDVAAHPDAPDVCIVGHDHLGFGVRKVNNTLFINPGALGRLSAHPAEMERPIQVALLTVEPGEDIYAELIPLKSARPGHEVLSRDHLVEAAEREAKTNEFLALLAEEGESRFLETREIIDDLAGREKLPREIVDEALRRIGEARERLGAAARQQ